MIDLLQLRPCGHPVATVAETTTMNRDVLEDLDQHEELWDEEEVSVVIETMSTINSEGTTTSMATIQNNSVVINSRSLTTTTMVMVQKTTELRIRWSGCEMD